MYKMMIVDDEPLMREYIKVNIPDISNRWQVTGEAMDGQDALELLKQQPYDLVITDIKMPVIDGIELCKILYDKYPSIKKVILSGYDEFDFARKALKYDVCEYLLKPVVKDELNRILTDITLKLDEEKSREMAIRSASILTEDTKKQVVKNFLKAVVMESSVEVKALYPLICRLEINLMESLGVIMILDLDEYVLIEKSIPITDIFMYRFILHQISIELLDESEYGIVFFDDCKNITIFVTGNNIENITNKCSYIYDKVHSTMLKNTGLSISGALGVAAEDVLHLHVSRNTALNAIKNRLAKGPGKLHPYKNDNCDRNFLAWLENSIYSIQSAILDNNNSNLHISISEYVCLINIKSYTQIIEFGIFLIKSISGLKHVVLNEDNNKAYSILAEWYDRKKEHIETDDVIKLLVELAKAFQPKNKEELQSIDEQEIVTRTKEYIYSHYSEPISLVQIAEKIGINSSYLSNMFHKTVGESYIKFLTRIRMEQAAKLLRSVPLQKVYDISEKVGYLSVKHFSYVFKQYYSMSPGEYQEKHYNA